MQIRPLDAGDIPACLDLSADRAWTRDGRQWELLLRAGQGWGIDAPDGGLAACVIVTPYDGAAAIGKVLVAARYGGRGLGRRITEHALATIGDAPAVLYATAMGRPLYERLGFRVSGQVTKHAGRYRPAPPEVSTTSGPVVRPAEAADWSGIVRRDRRAFGAGRAAMLERYAGMADAVVAEPDCGGHGGHAFAFRGDAPGAETLYIGPVSADTDAVALALIDHLARGAHLPVRIDVPDGHPDLCAALTARGLTAHDPDPRMTHGPDLPGDRRTYQAITNQALT